MTMSSNFRTLAVGATLAIASIGAFAQTASAPAATPRADQRQANQEQRIDKGIASGALTARESKRVERGQNVVNRAENKAKVDGTVTKAERRHLHKMQNQASKGIYRQKHDAQVAHKQP
jgi:hypothetical protein